MNNGSRVALAFLVPAIFAFWISGQPPALARPRPLAEFAQKMNECARTREKVKASLPKLPPKADPSEITTYRRNLAEEFKTARSGAHSGDLFTPDIAAEFRRILASAMSGPEGESTRTTITQGNPGRRGEPPNFVVAANNRYPESEPVSTVPPKLLLSLPELPDGFQYRFVGRDLIVLDSESNLIMDVLTEAAP